MTHAELVREARAIVPPVGADKAIALVDDQGHYRAAFLINGLKRSAPVGPSFDKPRAVCAFVDVINGEDRPASRSSIDSDSVPGPGGSSSGDEGGSTSEAPVGSHRSPGGVAGASVPIPSTVLTPSSGTGTCVICHNPLPAGSRSHRRTDTDACRRALARREADAGRDDAVGVRTDVPLSWPSSAAQDPTSPAGPRGYALRGSAEDAGPTTSPGSPDPDLLNLGLT